MECKIQNVEYRKLESQTKNTECGNTGRYKVKQRIQNVDYTVRIM